MIQPRRALRGLLGGLLIGAAAVPAAVAAMAVPAAAQEPRQVTLDEAVEIAIERNPDLRITASAVDRAEGARLGAYGAFLPSVELGYDYSTSSTGRLDPIGQSITSKSYTAELTAEYGLFSGFRRFTETKGARRQVDAARADYREQRYQTVLDVKTAWFAARAGRDRVRVEEERVERQERQLEAVRIQLDFGRVARSELLRSEIALNNARLALLRAEDGARASTWQLAEALGIEEPVEPAESALPAPAALSLTRAQVHAMARAGGPSLESAHAATEAARAGVASARTAYLPDLRVAGGYAWQSEDFPPSDRSWQLLVFGRFPLFDGFQRESALMQASADATAASAAERAVMLSLASEVDSAYNQIEIALSSIELTETAVALAGEELAMSEERYNLGRESFVDLQNVQIALRQAEVDRIRSRFDYYVGVARLEFLLGRELGA
ncbi:MAG: TolC family protein [Gemmatimonadota bacterium]